MYELDLFGQRRRGARVGALLLLAGAVAAALLFRVMTDDVHRLMFGTLAGGLAISAVVVFLAAGLR